MAILKRITLLAVLISSACGNPLVDGNYLGEPLYSFRGKINDFRFENQAGLDRYRASIFWSLTGQTSTIASELVEQKSISISNIFPPDVEIVLYNPPSGRGLERVDEPYYLGMIYLYEDLNENRELDPGELRGGASYNVVLYAKRDILAHESPSRTKIPAGYSLQEIPFACEDVEYVERASREENCGVPLGERCTTDEECAPGICDDRGPPQCMLPWAETGCVPKQGAYYPPTIYDGMEVPAAGWFLACDGKEDCPSDPGIGCHFFGFSDPDGGFVGTCAALDDLPAQIEIFEYFSCVVPPLCLSDFADTATITTGFICEQS